MANNNNVDKAIEGMYGVKKESFSPSFDNPTRRSSFSFSKILSLIFLILLGVAVIRRVFGYESFSFSSLLTFIKGAPQIGYDFLTAFADLKIIGNWGVFDFFRSFLNFFTSVLSLIVYVGTLFSNIIILLFYVIGFIFV